jgi:DNA-binding response OmpR family regulator
VDLLITDLALPGKNGFQLAQALCQIRPKLKVLFTSAQAGAELNRYYGIHQNDLNFLAKPFQSTELIARVIHCLESGGAQYGSAGC